jgi:tetratricopeptide (TPR) repeat protein
LFGVYNRSIAAGLAFMPALLTLLAAPLLMAQSGPALSFEQIARKATEAREAGRPDEALQYLRIGLERKPSWTEGWWSLGTILYDLDRHAEARAGFRRVVASEPDNGLVLALHGMCEFRLGNHERALAELQKARTLGISKPEIMAAASFDAAVLLNRFERYEAAFDVLRDFALQGRDSRGVIEAFGLSLLRLPYLPSEIPADKREAVLMAGRGGFQMAKGRRSETARLAFEELAVRHSSEPNVHYAYGTFLLLDEPERALQEFRRELRNSPNHYLAMLQIAFEQIKAGRYDEALPLAEKAVELAPTLHAARSALGRALLETGKVERAVAELEAGVKLAPASPEMRFALARAYQRAGRADDAARERAQFLRLDREARAARAGAQSVGGKPVDAASPPPKQNRER